MKQINTARVLMIGTIVLITAFQFYWINKLYKEEQKNFSRNTDLIFRDAIYRLQAERFKGDTMFFKGMPGDNLFMGDVIQQVNKNGEDENAKTRQLMISMKTNSARVFMDSTKSEKEGGDSVLFIEKRPGFPEPIIKNFFGNHTVLNDSLPIVRIDSMYQAMLRKENISVPFRIEQIKSRGDSLGKGVFNIQLNATNEGGGYSTRRVPVGFKNPVFYRAVFENPAAYLFKKVSWQIVLSLFLVALTALSFIFIYRNLLAQRRLTAIKNDFISNITHELKTPISTVSVAIEAMKHFNALDNPARTQEYLGIATQELSRLSLLVDKVLRLSMFEKQELELSYQWFDLEALVMEVKSSMQLQFEKTGARVEFIKQGDDFMVRADRMHLSSVLYNLLDNALKYSGEKAEIKIRLVANGDEFVLSIADHGIGIPPQYLSKVFDKFFRVPQGDQHNVKGYGLGLSYVSHIIKAHKGDLGVTSEPGETEFTIQLPKNNGS